MIPVIDLAPFVGGRADRARVAGLVDAACREVGFFSIVGHGVPSAVIDDAWDGGRRFFGQPVVDKMAVAMPAPGYPYGYSPVAGEALSYSIGGHGLPDLKESYVIGPIDRPPRPVAEMDDPDEQAVYAANLWPEVDRFRASWEVYYRSMSALAATLMEVFAVGLGLDRAYFAPMIDRHGSAMRMLHYPHQPVVPPEGQLRAGAHTDYGTLTILRTDDAPGGLQVRDVDDRWVTVPHHADSFIVNLGDLMARWTNDRWRSTLHRVVNPPVDPRIDPDDPGGSNERYSIAFFHNANWDARVTCLPTCLGVDGTATYPPVMAGAHLMAKFRSTVV